MVPLLCSTRVIHCSDIHRSSDLYDKERDLIAQLRTHTINKGMLDDCPKVLRDEGLARTYAVVRRHDGGGRSEFRLRREDGSILIIGQRLSFGIPKASRTNSPVDGYTGFCDSSRQAIHGDLVPVPLYCNQDPTVALNIGRCTASGTWASERLRP